jgi:hypothetical protein
LPPRKQTKGEKKMKWMTLKMSHKTYQEEVINVAHNTGIMWSARPDANGFIVEVEDNEFSRKVFGTCIFKDFIVENNHNEQE